MTALAVICVALLGQKAVLLILDDNWVAKAMGLALLVLPLFAVLTWRQAGQYKDPEKLWRTTVQIN